MGWPLNAVMNVYRNKMLMPGKVIHAQPSAKASVSIQLSSPCIIQIKQQQQQKQVHDSTNFSVWSLFIWREKGRIRERGWYRKKGKFEWMRLSDVRGARGLFICTCKKHIRHALCIWSVYISTFSPSSPTEDINYKKRNFLQIIKDAVAAVSWMDIHSCWIFCLTPGCCICQLILIKFEL